jgi:hypothetical protein
MGEIVIEVQVVASNVERDRAVIKFDDRFVRLRGGSAEVELEAGSFERKISWTLVAVEEVEQTWIGVTAGLQSAGFNLKVTGLRVVD